MGKENINNNEKNYISGRFLLVLSVIALVCIIFFIVSTCRACARDEFKKEINIVQNGETIDSMEIKSLSLHPSETVNYEIVLKTSVTGTYAVALDFNEKVDGGLKDYIVVIINDGDKNILNKGLSEVLSGDKIAFNCDIMANKPYVINVCYLMPKDVKNEAMGTTATFEIEFYIVLT